MILIVGSNGQLGNALKVVQPENVKVLYKSREELDITNKLDLDAYLSKNNFTHIVNVAAYTNVEGSEKNIELAMQVNCKGPENLATIAKQNNMQLIHVSTDYVFDGEGNEPLLESNPVNPLNTYGKTKLLGEEAIQSIHPNNSIIVRTSWLYSRYGNNFVLSMLRLMSEKDEIKVINDQFGSPTWAIDLAQALWLTIKKSIKPGLYHFANYGKVSWYELACEIKSISSTIGLLESSSHIVSIPSSAYHQEALRPKNTELNSNKICKALNISKINWKLSLKNMLEGLKNE